MFSRPPWAVSLPRLFAYLFGRQRHNVLAQSFSSGQVPSVEHRKQKEREFDSMGTGPVQKRAHRQLYREFY